MLELRLLVNTLQSARGRSDASRNQPLHGHRVHVEGLEEIEAENTRLKRLYANLALDNRALEGFHRPNALTPSEERDAVTYRRTADRLTNARACGLSG